MTIENRTIVPRALYRRTDIAPEVFFQALGRVRRAAHDEIERLISWLDTTIDCDQDAAVDDEPCDGDPDREPSLGSFDRMSDQIKAWQDRGSSAEIDVEVDNADAEPALAAPENHPEPPYTAIGYTGGLVVYGPPGQYRDCKGSQYGWAGGGRDDREGDDGGCGRYPSIIGARE